MGDKSNIQWCDASWNPTRGCSLVSPGCTHCYAMKQARRMDHPGGAYEGLTEMTSGGAVWTGKVREIPSVLDQPLRWRKPRRIFVDSMSDLFHEDVSDEFIDQVFAVMALAPQHTFQVLTKRAERMREYFAYEFRWAMIEGSAQKIYHERTGEDPSMWLAVHDLPSLWLGVSVEDQKRADERIPHLLATPAAVRFLSCEPLLGPVDLSRQGLWLCHHWKTEVPEKRWWEPQALRGVGQVMLDWVIVGGESGHKARPCQVEWVRDIVEQCQSAEVPVFVKQLGANYVDAANGIGGAQAKDPADPMATVERLEHSKGGDMDEWPADLRVREFPRGRHT